MWLLSLDRLYCWMISAEEQQEFMCKLIAYFFFLELKIRYLLALIWIKRSTLIHGRREDRHSCLKNEVFHKDFFSKCDQIRSY